MKGEFQSRSCQKDYSCLFVYGPLSLFAHSSVEQIWLYWAEAEELVLDRCVAYAPQGEMVLKKGYVSEREKRETERERERADGWVTQCSNIPGQ